MSAATRTRRDLPLLEPAQSASAAPTSAVSTGAAGQVGQECCAPLRSVALSVADAAVLAARFAALADPVRLRLLSLLASSAAGEVCACDLVEPVGKSQPTVSHHLKILREAGLITSQRRGVNIWYAVVPEALDTLRDALATPA